MQADQRSKTLVIPTYTVNDKLEYMAYECAKSHRAQVDQIIISEDGGSYSDKLREIADIYIYSHHNIGFTKNVNRAWNLSESDFTIIANSDTVLMSGNLGDICKDDPLKVCSPHIENQQVSDNGFSAFYFVVPRGLKEQYGMLDERLKNFQSDRDYYYRIRDDFLSDTRVSVFHYKSQTVDASGIDIKEESRADSLVYDQMLIDEYPERIIRK